MAEEKVESKTYVSKSYYDTKTTGEILSLHNDKGVPMNRFIVLITSYTKSEIKKGIKNLRCLCGRDTYGRGIWFRPVGYGKNNVFEVSPVAHCRIECVMRTAHEQPNCHQSLSLFNMFYANIIDVTKLIIAPPRCILHIKGACTLSQYHDKIDKRSVMQVRHDRNVRFSTGKVFIQETTKKGLVPEDPSVNTKDSNIMRIGFTKKSKKDKKPILLVEDDVFGGELFDEVTMM